MLSLICRKIKEEDEDIMNFRTTMDPCYQSLKFVIDDLKKDCDKAKNDLKASNSQFQMIVMQDPDVEDTIFGRQIQKFLKDSEKPLEESFRLQEKMLSEYTSICDFFMFSANDEVRQKSEKFFTFFTQFFDDVVKQLPKPEKKSVKKPAANAAKKMGQSDMMAELKAKMNKK
mmetsp:Transcript_10806/g.18111  ORF Transcript_10806/g.18111 Transcript_10806/m.18111 type:complete len:172 (-) Transcript_10806:52-567(-)